MPDDTPIELYPDATLSNADWTKQTADVQITAPKPKPPAPKPEAP
jgi:hypothetical protein